MLDAGGEEMRDEDGLSAAGGARDECRATGGQPAVGNDVETRNAGCDLLDAFMTQLRGGRHRQGSSSPRRESAMSTCSAFVRSPVTRRLGWGACFTRVGV